MKSAYSSTWCFVPRARRAWVWSAGPGGPSAVDGPCELPALEHTAGSVGRTRVRPTHPDLGGQLRTKGRGLPLNKSALLECEGTDMHHTRRAVPVTLQLSVSSQRLRQPPSLPIISRPDRSVVSIGRYALRACSRCIRPPGGPHPPASAVESIRAGVEARGASGAADLFVAEAGVVRARSSSRRGRGGANDAASALRAHACQHADASSPTPVSRCCRLRVPCRRPACVPAPQAHACV